MAAIAAHEVGFKGKDHQSPRCWDWRNGGHEVTPDERAVCLKIPALENLERSSETGP